MVYSCCCLFYVFGSCFRTLEVILVLDFFFLKLVIGHLPVCNIITQYSSFFSSSATPQPQMTPCGNCRDVTKNPDMLTPLTTWADFIVQELCESRGGRPGLSVLTSLMVSVDVKLY